MGQHRAHSVSELPAPLQERIRRVLEAPADGLKVSEQEAAEAAAELALPIEQRQSTLNLSPRPSAGKVYDAAKYTKNDAGEKVLPGGLTRG
jgi:hypothetical protein